MSQQSQALEKKAPPQHGKLITTMAERYNLEPGLFYQTIVKTLFPSDKEPSREQVAAFLMVANHYTLNPLTKEIYAFPAKGGGIVPVVSIDGWLSLINRHPDYNGTQFVDQLDQEGHLVSVTCKIHHKKRDYPMELTEYMNECKRGTDPWRQWPARMLRHKAMIQCARYAFGFAGIVDPDEAERTLEVEGAVISDMPKRLAQNVQTKQNELREKLVGAGKAVAVEAAEPSEVAPYIDAEEDAPEPAETVEAAPVQETPAAEPVRKQGRKWACSKQRQMRVLELWGKCIGAEIPESELRNLLGTFGYESRAELNDVDADEIVKEMSTMLNEAGKK